MSKLTYQKRNGHEPYRKTKKSRNASATSRRRIALKALEADLKTGRLRDDGERTSIVLTEGQKKRITKEIEILKSRV